MGLPCASFGATGRWRAATGAVDDVELVLNFAIDLFKERVVKLDGEERRPCEGFDDEGTEHISTHISSVVEPAENQQAKCVGHQAHDEREDAKDEHEVSGALVRPRGEGHRLVLERGDDNLKISCYAKSYERQENQAHLNPRRTVL